MPGPLLWLVGRHLRSGLGQGPSYERLIRSCRGCLWMLVAVMGLHLVAWRCEIGVVHGGWSVVLGQGSLQASLPLERPLPATFTVRNEVVARVSGLPIMWWFRVSTGVVIFASVPAWAIGVWPFARLCWCVRELRTRPAAGRCERCGYDLASGWSGRCPECGWSRDWLRAFRRGFLDRF